MTESAHRIAANALRAEFGVVGIDIELIYSSEDNRKIIFNALGKSFEFTATANPCKFAKAKWYAKKTVKIRREENIMVDMIVITPLQFITIIVCVGMIIHAVRHDDLADRWED